jgi:hypothetical protein
VQNTHESVKFIEVSWSLCMVWKGQRKYMIFHSPWLKNHANC